MEQSRHITGLGICLNISFGFGIHLLTVELVTENRIGIFCLLTFLGKKKVIFYSFDSDYTRQIGLLMLNSTTFL